MYQNEFLNKSLAGIFKNKIEVSFFGLRCLSCQSTTLNASLKLDISSLEAK